MTTIAVLLAAPLLTGFDLSRHSIPPEEILAGGPPKDGIPAILTPQFVDAEAAAFLKPEDVVISVVAGGTAKAYPLRILNWHEVVNDAIAGEPIAVTYCPLTASAVVYSRSVQGRTLSFGVSGRLYQSNVLFYDHQTESLWSQLKEEAVTGSFTATPLRQVPSVMTTWAGWRAAHPDTLVLALDTGYPRDYDRDPYAAYRASTEVMFPVSHVDQRLGRKEKVFGLRLDTAAKAYPLAALAKARHVDDQLGGHRVRIEYDDRSGRVNAVAADDHRSLPGIVVYWFAWSAFHPDTALWSEMSVPSAARPTPGGSAVAAPPVAILSHRAYWTDLARFEASGDGSGETPRLLVIRGEIRNESRTALDHVKFVFELLDPTGRTVASEFGYNRSAESLRPLDSPMPVSVEQPPVAPLAPGAIDSFRMVLLRHEIPEFTAYRVRVIESVPVTDGRETRERHDAD
jgi:hypothetical protein